MRTEAQRTSSSYRVLVMRAASRTSSHGVGAALHLFHSQRSARVVFVRTGARVSVDLSAGTCTIDTRLATVRFVHKIGNPSFAPGSGIAAQHEAAGSALERFELSVSEITVRSS